MILIVLATALLFVTTCSPNNSTTVADPQRADASTFTDEKVVTKLDCNKPNEYSFKVVENFNRRKNGEPLVPKDLIIVIGEDVAATIRLPIPDSEARNFSLTSVEKTKAGFEVNVEWGGGFYYYEIRFEFICRENKFYLYKVTNDNFSTLNPDSGNFLDKKETKTTNIEPNVPIDEFDMLHYLRRL